MELPHDVSSELKKYEKYASDEDLLKVLKTTPQDLIDFFLIACEDETWIESHLLFMQEVLYWLTDANLNSNFSQDFFSPVISPIQKHINILKPLIPLDLTLKIQTDEYRINSMMLSNQSFYFKRRLMNECRGLEKPVLRLNNIPLQIIELIDEYILTGEIRGLWKLQPDELWSIIDPVALLGIPNIIKECEILLRRYIERNQVFEMLTQAHQKRLQLLQNACIEFINQMDLGVHLKITPVEWLWLEFLDFKEKGLTAFNQLSAHLTHLAFSSEETQNRQFSWVVKQCPRLIGLDLSASTAISDFLEDIPEHVLELYLSNCLWINHLTMQTLSKTCPQLKKLDLSSNDQLTYTLWSHLQGFKKLISLDISRCFQLGDNELKIISQACPKLVELNLTDCSKVTSEGFFEVGKSLHDLSILNISHTLIFDDALMDLLTRCKNLYSLDISRCYHLSERGVVEAVKNCPQLKMINLRNTNLKQIDIERIRKNNPFLTLIN